jgi:hypothetical protein
MREIDRTMSHTDRAAESAHQQELRRAVTVEKRKCELSKLKRTPTVDKLKLNKEERRNEFV